MSFEDAGDVVQDAFVVAVGKLDPAKNPRAWLYQVVDHLAANHQRKAIRRARLAAQWDPPDGSIRHREGLDE
jgi:DNA-directed RNA polymerase specialized sigma24 family protein